MKNIGCAICGGHDLPHEHGQLVRVEGAPTDVCTECSGDFKNGPHLHRMIVTLQVPSWQGTLVIPEDK